MRTKLFAGVAFAALLIPGAAFAQSTASTEVEGEIVVTGTAREPGIEGIVVPDGTKARQVLTNEILNRQDPGNTVLQALNLVPGVNFTNNDPYGSSGGNIRIRGFDGNRISLTFDGFPLNDTGNYAIFSNQQLDPELVSEVNVNLGTTDVDSPTASAAGGTINYRTIVPSEEMRASATVGYGDFDRIRAFGLFETGNLTSFGTRAFASASWARNDKFKGPGRIEKQQFNAGIYQPLGSNGDFIRLSGHYNSNRNAFYRNPGVADLRTALGAGVIPAAGSPTAPLVISTDLSDAQINTVYGIERDAICVDTNRTFSGCSNFQGLFINPSNTGNARFNSRFTLSDQFTLFVDAGYQYVLANGGGTTTLAESSARARGANVASAGVDYNGDGDTLDTVRFYTPNNTNTNRITATASLIWNFSEGQRFRVAYTFDRGVHRQTGEWGYLGGAGYPESPFSGREARPVLTNDGFVIQQRNRRSIALLNQIAGEYIGNFFDDRLTVQVGLRAPFFQRDLATYCPIQARDGFAYCTSEPIAARGTVLAAGSTSAIYVNQGDNLALIPSTARPVYAPFARTYRYSTVLPNVGAVFRFTENASIFASYAQGYSAPRTDNLYRAPVVTTRPERTNAVDLGLRYTSRTVQAQLTGWYIGYQNRIVTSFDQDQGISVDRNVGSVDSYGFDLGVTVRPAPWVALTGIANYIHAELKRNVEVGTAVVGGATVTNFALTSGRRVVETPEWQFGGRAQFTFGPFELGVQGKWVDERYATDVNDVVVPSYTLIDLDARLNLRSLGLERTYLQLNVQNLFDEFYYGSISSQINAFNTSCVVNTCSTSQPSFAVGYPRTITASIHFGF